MKLILSLFMNKYIGKTLKYLASRRLVDMYMYEQYKWANDGYLGTMSLYLDQQESYFYGITNDILGLLEFRSEKLHFLMTRIRSKGEHV